MSVSKECDGVRISLEWRYVLLYPRQHRHQIQEGLVTFGVSVTKVKEPYNIASLTQY